MWIRDTKGRLVNLDRVRHIESFEHHVDHHLDNPIECYWIQAVVTHEIQYRLAEAGDKEAAQRIINGLMGELNPDDYKIGEILNE